MEIHSTYILNSCYDVRPNTGKKVNVLCVAQFSYFM